MMPGREYGILKFGRNTYDKWRQGENWVPNPSLPSEIWVPIVPPSGSWAPILSTQPEIWTPIPEPIGAWAPING